MGLGDNYFLYLIIFVFGSPIVMLLILLRRQWIELWILNGGAHNLYFCHRFYIWCSLLSFCVKPPIPVLRSLILRAVGKELGRDGKMGARMGKRRDLCSFDATFSSIACLPYTRHWQIFFFPTPCPLVWNESYIWLYWYFNTLLRYRYYCLHSTDEERIQTLWLTQYRTEPRIWTFVSRFSSFSSYCTKYYIVQYLSFL